MSGKVIGKCETARPYTGAGSCPKQEGKTIALLITSRDATYPLDETAFKSGLPGYVVDQGVLRMYPVTSIVENTISGGDVATSEIGFGGAFPTGENATSEVYRLVGNDCLAKELKKMNKKQFRVFRVDNENFVYGRTLTVGNTEKFAGFNATIFVVDAKQTGADPGGINITVFYSPNYENEKKDINAVAVDSIPEGLVAVELQAKGAGYKVVSVCSGSDYTATYGTDWDATMFATSAGTSPSSVAFSASTGLLTLSPSGAYRVKNASVLSAGDVYGIEGIEKFVSL